MELIMRCFVGVLLLGICVGVGAHNTPKIRNGTEFHAPFTDSHENMRAGWPEGHWHYMEGGAGAWDRCVAASYKESTDRYDFALMRVKCRERGGSTDSDANAPPTIHPEMPHDDMHRETESSGINCDSMEALTFSYHHTFPAGVSTQHIPLDILDVNQSGAPISTVPGVFDRLGDSAASLIASRGVSGWTYVTRPDTPAHDAIGKSIGFVAVMHEEVTVEITGTFGGWTGSSPTAYQILYLRPGGLTLLGVPLRSASLQTVGDFFTFFSNVESVMGIDPDLEIDTTDTPIRVEDDWFVELDEDTVIEGHTSYLIRSDGAAQRALWGVPWAYELSSAAPGARRAGDKKTATTWGAIKSL
ncbi:MAG: hypothetical protein OXI86_04260 [Candidatus Poribacteria bacterium]|nr:hypothetical protein [Candidatus Poribacteria bacterium]